MADASIALKSAAAFLEAMADTLDGWAKESRAGGWSTHQVQANLYQAARCRLMAAELRNLAAAAAHISEARLWTSER